MLLKENYNSEKVLHW